MWRGRGREKGDVPISLVPRPGARFGARPPSTYHSVRTPRNTVPYQTAAEGNSLVPGARDWGSLPGCTGSPLKWHAARQEAFTRDGRAGLRSRCSGGRNGRGEKTPPDALHADGRIEISTFASARKALFLFPFLRRGGTPAVRRIPRGERQCERKARWVFQRPSHPRVARRRVRSRPRSGGTDR